MATYEILKITHQGKSIIVGAVTDGDDRTWRTWRSEDDLSFHVATADPEVLVKLDGHLALALSSQRFDANIKALGFREIPDLKRQAAAFLESNVKNDDWKNEASLTDLERAFALGDFAHSATPYSQVRDDADFLPAASPIGEAGAERQRRHDGLNDLLVAETENRRGAPEDDRRSSPVMTREALESSLLRLSAQQFTGREIGDFEDLIFDAGDDEPFEDDFFENSLDSDASGHDLAAAPRAISEQKSALQYPVSSQVFKAGQYPLTVYLTWQPAQVAGLSHGLQSEMVWASDNIRPQDVVSIVPIGFRAAKPSIEIRLVHRNGPDEQSGPLLRLLAQVLNPQFAQRPAIMLRQANGELLISLQARPEEYCLIDQDAAELLLRVAGAAVRASSLSSKS